MGFMVFSKRQIFVGLTWLLIIACGLVALQVGFRRFEFEQSSRKVDVAVQVQDLRKLAALGGVDFGDLLDTLGDTESVSSIVLEENTLENYVEDGRVSLLRGSEVLNMHRVRVVNRFIVDNLIKRVRSVRSGYFYLIIDLREDYRLIEDLFKAEFGENKVEAIGRYDNILEVLDEREDLLQTGMGFDPDVMKQITNAGFKVVPMVKGSRRINEKTIQLKFEPILDDSDVETVLFEGEEIIGYPKYIDSIRSKLSTSQKGFGRFEFFHQQGIGALSGALPEQMVRVHTIGESELEKMAPEKAVRRYVRAVKERRARMIVVKPYFAQLGGEQIVAFNLRVLKDIKAAVEGPGTSHPGQK